MEELLVHIPLLGANTTAEGLPFCGDADAKDCYIQAYLQFGVTALGIAGAVTSLLSVRAVPRPVAGVLDSLRGALLALLCVLPTLTLVLGLAFGGMISTPEMVGALVRSLAGGVLAPWQRYDAPRSPKEHLWMKLWVPLALVARALVLYLDCTEGRPPVITAISALETIVAAALCVAFLLKASRPLADPLLASGAGRDLEAVVTNGQTFERTLSTRDPSPESQVGLIGYLAFAWFTPIVDLAFERDRNRGKLDPHDLYPLMEGDRAERQRRRVASHWLPELQRANPSLGNAMARGYWRDLLGVAWIKVLNDALHFVGPFLLNRIITFVKEGSDDDLGWGYFYAIAMVSSSFAQAFLMAHYFQGGYRMGMRLRCGLILMIYEKALRVLPWPTPAPPPDAAAAAAPPPTRRCCKPKPGRKKPPPGVGSMGQMTNLISADTDKFSFLMPYFNLLWSAPLQLVICFVMLFAYVRWALLAGVFVMAACTALSAYVQGKARKFQAEAMKAKDERLKLEVELLKIVKIIKLYAWELTIEDRVKELRNKEMGLQLRYKLWSVGMFLSFSLSPTLVALATFTFYTAAMDKTLDAATAFTALSLFNILTFPLGAMPMMARFLMEAAVAKDRIEAFLLAPEVAPRPPPPPLPELAIELTASGLAWPDGSELMQKVSFRARKGEFVAVVGRTGVGKSGLLYALLGELPIKEDSGRTYLAGTVGYCAQVAWVRNASLRDNITGGVHANDHDSHERYEQVVDACCLLQDIRALNNGEDTMIGDRGINLSGGQKQRVALARAVYANPDVYILDDVLSALDAHVAKEICTKLLKGPLLKGKTVVLVTHSHQALSLADRIVALGDKQVQFDGTFKQFEAEGRLNQLGPLLDEANGNENEAPVPAAAPAAQPNPTAASPSPGRRTPVARPGGGPGGPQEDRRQGAVSWAVYRAYAVACGGVGPVGFFLLTLILSEGSKNASDAWLTHWSDSKGSAAEGALVYAAVAIFSCIFGLGYVVTRVYLGQAGSRRLHESCVLALLRAQMSFYDQTPNGQILNRLAEDTNILDYNLPMTMAANMIWAWRSAAIVVVCMLVQPLLAFLILPMFTIYSKLAQRYLPATRDLRRLDAAARSPIFSHFSETMGGVSTIRAMQRQEQALQENTHKMERQMEAYYLSNTAARWLSLRLQFNGSILVGAVCLLGIGLRNSLSAGIVGVAITYAMKLTDTLNQVNRESADRETQMVSVERVHHYATSVPQEAPLENRRMNLPLNWPNEGAIRVEGIEMSYRDNLPLVLKGISLDIKAGERVGIVGRTGCGKSSFLSALLRIVELKAGRIMIDGVNVGEVGLHDLRKKAAIIPQDPAILTGTVRFNLDPFGMVEDEKLWDALEKSQLRTRVTEAGGLDSKVEEGGGNYSVGELQLMCLARALLRRQERGGLLLLDEATSALDSKTDETIQKVIREEFHCTTITIAHRVQTLLDYDRVVVLSDGQVVEFDTPKALLSRQSEFQSLAREAGITV